VPRLQSPPGLPGNRPPPGRPRPLARTALSCAALVLCPFAASAQEPDQPPLKLPPVEIVSEPLPGQPRAQAAQSTVIDLRRFEGEARTVAELLATSPGTSVSQAGPGQLAQVGLRGASADESLILLDGIPLTGPAGGSVDLSTLPSSLLSKMIVSRGVLGAQLGAGALGGAVELVPLTVEQGRQAAGLSLSGGSFGTGQLAADFAATTSSGIAWTGGLQLDRTAGDFPYAHQLTPEVGGPYYAAVRSNADAWRTSGLLRGETPTSLGALDLLLQLSAGERGLPGADGMETPNARSSDQSGLFGLRLRHLVGEGVLTTRAWVRGSLLGQRGLGIGFGDCGTSLSSAACAPSSSHTVGARGEAELSLPLGASQVLSALVSTGGEWEAGDFTGIHRRAIGSARVTDDATLLSGALSLHPSLRFDLVGEVTALSPGFGLVVRPLRGTALEPLELRTSVGSSLRPPSFSELYLSQGPTTPNPALRPERAVSVDAGAGYATERFNLSVSAFWSRYTDLILYELFPPARAKAQNIGQARIAGVELQALVQLPLSATLEASYSYLDAINERPSVNEGGQQLPYRAPHRLYARLARRGERLEAFFQGTYNSSMPRNAFGTAFLPAQVRLDAGAGVRVAGPVWCDLEVRNLLNDQTQQDLFQYPLPGLSLLATVRARL
jgi:vitamin B12 transporter